MKIITKVETIHVGGKEESELLTGGNPVFVPIGDTTTMVPSLKDIHLDRRVSRPISYEERVFPETYRNGFTGETVHIGMTVGAKRDLKETFDFVDGLAVASHTTMEELSKTRARLDKLTRRLDGVEKERDGLQGKNRALKKGREDMESTLEYVRNLTFWGRLLFLFRGWI